MANSLYIRYPSNNSGGGGVTTINGASGPAINILGGTGITVNTAGNNITINASGSSFTPGNLTDTGVDGITITGGANAVNGSGTSISQHVADATHNGYLSSSDWTLFESSVNVSNYITNPNAEINTAGWNLYNNAGNTTPAYLINQDLTFTSALAGSGGNGVDIEYIYNASFPAATPNINVISSTHVQVQWNNGPTISNNPTATQLKAAWDAVPSALAIATVAITGTASRLQYINGQEFMGNGGDAAPTTGTGGTVNPAVTFTRNTITPLVGNASFDLFKDANSRQGTGISTDFSIDLIDQGKTLQISFVYQGSTNMVLGASSDIQMFVYDITNAVLIPVTPTQTLSGPDNTPKEFTGIFKSSPTSLDYRLIFHMATTNTLSWDFLLDEVTVNDDVATEVTKVPSLVLQTQPISGAVTDHMVVMWRDGATQWVPATIAGAAIPAFGSDKTQLGFATNIVGSTADIYIRGAMDGFSFGPFTGFDQYIDNTAGMISPLPSPFTDTYVIVGMAISSTVLNIQFDTHVDLISNASGTPLKGGLLSNSAVNDGTGDQVLSVGSNGNALIANSAASLGMQWAPAVVAAAPFTYTTATRTLTIATATNAVAGVLSAADHTTYSGYAATIALKAPLASPAFTGDVNSSTGNVLISTIGKGLEIKTGTNSKLGTAVLVAGTVTVVNSSVTANSRIFLTSQSDGGTPGFLRITTKTAGTSFVITSSSPLDTSTVAWNIIESIP